jgi:hypothetical protein
MEGFGCHVWIGDLIVQKVKKKESTLLHYPICFETLFFIIFYNHHLLKIPKLQNQVLKVRFKI